MQRKATNNTRGPNAEEKRFQAYTKQCDCIVCDCPGPSIVDHCYGATAKHNKVLVGHWWVIPLCLECDTIKTQGNAKRLISKIGMQFKDLWILHTLRHEKLVPTDVLDAIADYREYVP